LSGTVLVVEDDPSVRDVLHLVLDSEGYAVVPVEDGLEALERLDEALPDLILLDLMLPRLDGFEVVRRLKADARTSHIPVLALTALARPSERDEALAAGCDGLILKPFDTEDLIRTVSDQLTAKSEGV